MGSISHTLNQVAVATVAGHSSAKRTDLGTSRALSAGDPAGASRERISLSLQGY